MVQYAWVKAKTLGQIQFFNVDPFAERLVEKGLAAGYRQGRIAQRLVREGRKEKKGLTELYWLMV